MSDNAVMCLASESAPGWNDIPVKFIKFSHDILVPLITSLCNLCFSNSIFPKLVKHSVVTPVHKEGIKIILIILDQYLY